MKCDTAVVKLGGSVITVKNKPETINREALTSVTKSLSTYYNSGGRLIVVHGGGSFGHYTVRRLLDSKGGLEVYDAPIIQDSMLKLAVNVVESLLGAGVPATLHPAHTLCSPTCRFDPIRRDLEYNLVPVTYGDAIVSKSSVLIVSGDDLAADIAVAIRASCLIYAVDVDGVLDAKGRLIKVVSGRATAPLDSTIGFDVTGGMNKKIEAALKAAMHVPNVRIISHTRLPEALKGKDVGSLIKPP